MARCMRVSEQKVSFHCFSTFSSPCADFFLWWQFLCCQITLLSNANCTFLFLNSIWCTLFYAHRTMSAELISLKFSMKFVSWS